MFLRNVSAQVLDKICMQVELFHFPEQNLKPSTHNLHRNQNFLCYIVLDVLQTFADSYAH